MKIGLLLVLLVVVLAGCTASHRQGATVPAFSELPSPVQLDGHNLANSSAATNTSRNARDEGVIRVGDTLLVTFTNSPQMPLCYGLVKRDGGAMIFNRTFQAAGKKTHDLEKEIRDYYVPAYFTNLRLQIATGSCVYLEGEFRNPGRYPWTNGMTLKDAIEVAGGFTEFANHRIKIIRADGITQTYRLLGDWAATNNPVLKQGDRIYNPRTIF